MSNDTSIVSTQVRRGAYYDSVVLMQLQRALATLEGIEDAGVVMATAANKEILAQSQLLDDESTRDAVAEDLVIAVRGRSFVLAAAALEQVDALLAYRSSSRETNDYLPRSLHAAASQLPEADWVLVSTPGRFAAEIARDALRLGKNVFLYSDNVSLEDEVSLKGEAHARGLLVMGPDCGTAIVNGIGLGFANRVRRGPIGLVGASGTGLQHVTSRIHQAGSGITHALGTGGRDLSDAVGAITTLHALDLLARDPDTRVIVLISKPPAPAVAEHVLRRARSAGKPVVVLFLGHLAQSSVGETIHFVTTLDVAAALAVELASNASPPTMVDESRSAARCLRGLYSGGSLAYEAQLILRDSLANVWSNAPLDKALKLEPGASSQGHAILDLGEDEFTVGRLHPMLDNELRIKRLLREAADPTVGVILLDVVLGDGSHPDPSSELAPAIAEARRIASDNGRTLPVIVVLVGTDADPQGLDMQANQLRAAGADVYLSHEEAVRCAACFASDGQAHVISTNALRKPLAALNVGLASFAASLAAQGAPVLQVDWRPPAGGNERLAGILARMKQ